MEVVCLYLFNQSEPPEFRCIKQRSIQWCWLNLIDIPQGKGEANQRVVKSSGFPIFCKQWKEKLQVGVK